jgi:CHAD domain-containing protein
MADNLEEPPDLLLRSPEEGARRLALGYLDQAAAALPRLADAGDSEALHDLRVALRRLRSCLKSYEPQLGASVPRQLARRLERLARATGPGRDAEVQIEWLRKQRSDRLRGHHRHGKTWLERRLEARVEEAYGKLRARVGRDFARVERGLRLRLTVYRAEVRLDDSQPPLFAAAAADVLRQHAGKLGRRLGRVRDAGDVESAHAARIGAKRLRYLADPLAQLLAARNREARPGQLVQRLKGLQDLLGELHDAHVMEAELEQAVVSAAAERARRLLDLTLQTDGQPDPGRLQAERRRTPEPGLLALARLNHERRDRLFDEFARRWQGEGAEQLLAAAEQLAEALRAVALAVVGGDREQEERQGAGQGQGEEAAAGKGEEQAEGPSEAQGEGLEGLEEGLGERESKGQGDGPGREQAEGPGGEQSQGEEPPRGRPARRPASRAATNRRRSGSGRRRRPAPRRS